MSITIRPVAEDELDAYVAAIRRGFGDEPSEGERDRVTRLTTADRTKAAFDGDRMVGTLGAFPFSMAVPGEIDVATAGLTRVTVAGSHRRQGILTAMMAAHFDEAVDHGEPLSILWASEAMIYGRFGYGQTTDTLTVSFDARLAGIRPPASPDDVVMPAPEEARPVMPDLHERVRRTRPGQFRRDEAWWELRHFVDLDWMKEGTGPRRHLIASRDGQPTGYATYRQKKIWNDLDIPEGEIHVQDLVAADDVAEQTLWSTLSSIDLFPKVKAWSLPTDTMLPWIATNPRAVDRRLTDGIQLRVLDVEAALTARRYDHPGSLVIEVTDTTWPAAAGRYRLDVGDDGAGRCTRTDEAAELHLTAAALGTLYLGARSPRPLITCGEIEGPADAARAAERCFRWPVAPWCSEGF